MGRQRRTRHRGPAFRSPATTVKSVIANGAHPKMRAVRRTVRKADSRKRQGLTPVQSAAKRSGNVNPRIQNVGLGSLTITLG